MPDKRIQNERKFTQWETLPSGGRRYQRDIKGRLGWVARRIKEVDANETTTLFRQEIYNAPGILVEIHNKYPTDEGHQRRVG
jgi:hypothetical protein